MRGVPADELERMSRQAAAFGSERLSRTADLVIATLDEMTGATSPRLQLELMVARVLARGGPVAAAPGAPVAQGAPVAAPVSAPAPSRAPVIERARNKRDETSHADPESSPRFDSPGPVPSERGRAEESLDELREGAVQSAGASASAAAA